jgi:hypothetical protein
MIFMLDVLYNAVMPKRVPNEERKDFQVGFRVNRAQRQRLDALVERIKSQNKRVEASEVYEELMSLKDPEFITDRDRVVLLGKTEFPENRSTTLKRVRSSP